MSKITFGGGGGGGGSDHGGLAGLGDDDHPQYILLDGDRTLATGVTATSGAFKALSGVFSDDLQVSGISVGDFLSAHTSDHGALGGLGDDDHTQYLLENGNRVGSGLALASGITPATSGEGHIGTTDMPFSSGIFKTDGRIIFWGGSDGQSPGIANSAGSLNIIAANGNQTNLAFNTCTAGTGGQIRFSGRGRIDSPNSSLVRILDSNATVSGQLQASGVRLIAPNGSGWLVSVDNNGVLETTGPVAL